MWNVRHIRPFSGVASYAIAYPACILAPEKLILVGMNASEVTRI